MIDERITKISMTQCMGPLQLCREDVPAVRRACILIGFVRDLRQSCDYWPPELPKIIEAVLEHSNIKKQAVVIKEQKWSKHSGLVWACTLAAAALGGEQIAGTLSSSCGITRGAVLSALQRTLSTR